MASRLNPYITFTNNAKEAMEFYKEVFGGTLDVHTFGEYGAKDSPEANNIMHGMLETDRGFTLMAADTPQGQEYRPGTNIAVSLSGDDDMDLRTYWDKLADGGTVTVPFEKQMWGDEFGFVIDRFGTGWMVDIVHPQPT